MLLFFLPEQGGRLGSIAAQVVDGSLQQSPALLLTVTAMCMCLGALCAAPLPSPSKLGAMAD